MRKHLACKFFFVFFFMYSTMCLQSDFFGIPGTVILRKARFVPTRDLCLVLKNDSHCKKVIPVYNLVQINLKYAAQGIRRT